MRLLKRLLRYGKSGLYLNRTRQQAAAAFEQTNSIQHSLRDLFELLYGLDKEARERLAGLETALSSQTSALAAQSELSAALRRSYDQRLSAVSAGLQMLSRLTPTHQPLQSAATDNPKLPIVLENFYVALESRFRGATSDISQRQAIYLPDIKQALATSDTKVVLDVGCGRGEWLSLLRGHGIESVGIDSNEGQLAEARRNGLAVWNRDALEFLREQSEGSFAAITAFHIFEHLPFPVLAEWIMEIRRVLAPGGVLIAETPNPENLIVGANTFHLDPTHVRPLPSGVLSILCETAGLAVRQIRALHPHGDLAAALKELPERAAYLLYGYQDYGLIAERPKTEML